MFDPLDIDVTWLNITNFMLGVVTVLAIAAVVFGTVKEIIARVRSRATVPAEQDTHSFVHPDLGLTMADGGEPVKPDTPEAKKSPR
jgi:hypothetical protein